MSAQELVCKISMAMLDIDKIEAERSSLGRAAMKILNDLLDF